MAEPRARPYSQFNFQVQFLGGQAGNPAPDSPDAGFQEVSGIGMEVTVAEYRNGNFKENSVMKINGLNKASDVTLKRGIFGTLRFYQWLHEIRNGTPDQLQDVVVKLMNEAGTQPVLTWTLKQARIIKFTSGPLNAKGGDVAMEELVLSYERLEMD